MLASEYTRFDALGLASLLRSAEVSPKELMACALELARARAPALNALCHEQYEASLEIAAHAQPQGVFGAVPFLLKDSALASRRFPSGLGSRLFRNLQFKYDSTLVRRFDQAGLIAFARTTVPELCMSPTTEATANGGPTRNPWNREHSAGGSSGGTAAAVAAGIVAMGHGSDGGGSIRIPASCCGLYGLKPSRGRVPVGPARGEVWAGLATDGVISRSVRDTAAALDAMSGMEPGAPYAAPSAPDSYLRVLSEAFDEPLRVGVWTAAWDQITVDDECAAAVLRAAALIRAAGHEVIPLSPPELDYAGFIEAHISVLAANVVASVNSLVKGSPMEEWQHELEPAILDGYRLGRTLDAQTYLGAINAFHSIGRKLERHMAGVDLILTPALTRPPARIGEFSTQTDFRGFRLTVARYTAFLVIANASGQPSASVPLHWTPSGLPVGVQLLGHFGREDQILKLSAQLEAAAPWAYRFSSLYPPESSVTK